MAGKYKTINLPEAIYDRLGTYGTAKTSFGEVIVQLMDAHDSYRAGLPWVIRLVLAEMEDLYGRDGDWEATENGMENLIAEIPYPEVRAAAQELLDEMRDEQGVYADE